MYTWLAKEAEAVKWRYFFKFEHDYESDVIRQLEAEAGPLPADYKLFVQHYGTSSMFRRLTEGSYNLIVFSHPRILPVEDGWLLEIGFYINGAYAHFRKQPPTAQFGPGVYEGPGLRLRKVADSFEAWLRKRFECTKRLYKKKQWALISRGADRFSSEELDVIRAMELFFFEKVGVAPNGNALIRVTNRSEMELPILTIGVLAKGRLKGAVGIDVAGVKPGETKIIEGDCYKSVVPADRVELFRKPHPEPEDRGMFFEFRELNRAET